MPAPERTCLTCIHYRPYEGRLAETFGKCDSPHRPVYIRFAEILRGDDSLCGPAASWWERRPPKFQIVEDDPSPPQLEWEEDED